MIENLATHHVQLTDLVGLHEISAIWRGMIKVPWIGSEETVQAIVLVVDDHVVIFVEGPNDGYRSSLGDVYRMSGPQWAVRYHEILGGDFFGSVGPPSLTPIHPPIVASFAIRDWSYYANDGERSEVLYAVNERTDLCVFEIGTDNIDDYYPSFVFDWQPAGYRPAWLDNRYRRDAETDDASCE